MMVSAESFGYNYCVVKFSALYNFLELIMNLKKKLSAMIYASLLLLCMFYTPQLEAG